MLASKAVGCSLAPQNCMLQICIGGVCVPLNVLLPFLVGAAHRAGWLKWVKCALDPPLIRTLSSARQLY